jgi:head-tail adaptor
MIKKDNLTIDSKNLKHFIEFYSNANAGNLLVAEQWTKKYECFAEVMPLGGSSFASIDNMDFGHITPENLVMFKIRFASGITNKLRIMLNNQNFDIKKIINVAYEDKILQIIGQEVI